MPLNMMHVPLCFFRLNARTAACQKRLCLQAGEIKMEFAFESRQRRVAQKGGMGDTLYRWQVGDFWVLKARVAQNFPGNNAGICIYVSMFYSKLRYNVIAKFESIVNHALD